MAITDVFRRALAGELRLSRGRIAAVEPGGRARVRFEPAGTGDAVCDVLQIGAEPPALHANDEVLVACAAEPGKPGVILGRVGPAAVEQETPAAVSVSAGEPRSETPREIVIEAGEELTLKCGEASIRITRDGKVVIRGEHILSRAKGTQRIKGGSVAIN